MNCPSCGGTKFEKIGNSVYCVNKVAGKLCGVTLKGDLRRKYFEKYATHKDRKKYFNEYYHRNKKRFKDGLILSEAAALKFTTWQTVKNNLHKFDVVPGSHPRVIIFNKKFLKWCSRGSKNNN